MSMIKRQMKEINNNDTDRVNDSSIAEEDMSSYGRLFCFKASESTLLDVLLTNKPTSFQRPLFVKLDWVTAKLVATIFRLALIKLPP